jgi:hypothetical protein
MQENEKNKNTAQRKSAASADKPYKVTGVSGTYITVYLEGVQSEHKRKAIMSEILNGTDWTSGTTVGSMMELFFSKPLPRRKLNVLMRKIERICEEEIVS